MDYAEALEILELDREIQEYIDGMLFDKPERMPPDLRKEREARNGAINALKELIGKQE